MDTNKQFVFIAGVGRSGSTLLSSILSQNPLMHAEGSSALCTLMWAMQNTFVNDLAVTEQIKASGRFSTQKEMISALPYSFYKGVEAPIIIDKCRSWTLPNNVKMIREYIGEPKIIVLERPVVEVIRSFVAMRRSNGREGDLEQGLFEPGSEPLMRPYIGTRWAKEHNNGEFLFVTYDDLVDNTQEVLKKIYEFCGWAPFEHQLTNIVNPFPDNDEVYKLLGMHDVRPVIGRRGVEVKLSDDALQKCENLEKYGIC